MQVHRAGRCKKNRSVWPGLFLAGVILVVTIASVARIGWIALAPFGFAALILAILLWLMRATDRAAK
ncbi:MAG TPA: hypothetical protein VFL17_20960 [Anaerolineae bacterium]|nr:hypothetical protein [Anaerolineae bacterium]